MMNDEKARDGSVVYQTCEDRGRFCVLTDDLEDKRQGTVLCLDR